MASKKTHPEERLRASYVRKIKRLLQEKPIRYGSIAEMRMAHKKGRTNEAGKTYPSLDARMKEYGYIHR